MGRCLAFNYGPAELKQKLKGVRYFVYSPDFDSAVGHYEQNFFAVIDSAAGPQDLRDKLTAALEMQATRVRFVDLPSERQLHIVLESREPYAAITDVQIEDAKRADAILAKMNLKAAHFTRYQDVVFGDDHILKKDLSKPFRKPGALFVPVQKDWFAGRSFDEANTLFNKVSLRK